MVCEKLGRLSTRAAWIYGRPLTSEDLPQRRVINHNGEGNSMILIQKFLRWSWKIDRFMMVT